MEHDRDEHEEDIIESMIRGEDVTELFMNNSGGGDESLNRGVGSGEVEADGWGEVEADGWGEVEADGCDEGEAGGSGGTLKIANSDEVHIYIN